MGSEGIEGCIEKNVMDSTSDESCKDTEPPLKKAKYAWQVKGKYHLKGTTEGHSSDSSQHEESSSHVTHKQTGESENCGGSCCIETLLTNSDAYMASGESSDEECFLRRSPILLARSMSPKNHDYFLNKWQERQLVRGYLDNHVNEVIERFMPIASIDVGGIIDDCDSDGTVEDEGILMAIQSHGLHSCKPTWPDDFHLPLSKEHQITESALDNLQNAQNELLKSKEEESFVDFEMGFLDAAVAAAIEKKGLSSQSY